MSRWLRPARLAAGRSRSVLPLLALPLLSLTMLALAAPVAAQRGPVDLTDAEYQAVSEAAARLDHLALLPPPAGAVGAWLVIGDRYGLVRIAHVTHGASREVWKSKQLSGIVEEVLVADLDGDGIEEIVARTNSAIVYVWNSEDLKPRYESLTTDFQKVHSLTIGNVDDDEWNELIVNADRHLYYLDGRSYNREFTSIREYEATRMRCGDVDGDRSNEIVLNTGEIVDSRNGDVEWADEVFGARIDLADVDGDLIPEVLTESDGAPLRIFDVDLKKEKHLQ